MYCFNYKTDPDTGESFVFSALDTTATRQDFDNAENDGVINAAWKAALIANLYTSDNDAPKAGYWAAF
jgi:hypothetical protein